MDSQTIIIDLNEYNKLKSIKDAIQNDLVIVDVYYKYSREYDGMDNLSFITADNRFKELVDINEKLAIQYKNSRKKYDSDTYIKINKEQHDYLDKLNTTESDFETVLGNIKKMSIFQFLKFKIKNNYLWKSW